MLNPDTVEASLGGKQFRTGSGAASTLGKHVSSLLGFLCWGPGFFSSLRYWPPAGLFGCPGHGGLSFIVSGSKLS